MTRWPWITMAAAALVIVSPPGQDIFSSAFLSGEQLARNIWRPIVLVGVAILIVLGLVEWLIRTGLARRRRAASPPGVDPEAGAPVNHKMEK